MQQMIKIEKRKEENTGQRTKDGGWIGKNGGIDLVGQVSSVMESDHIIAASTGFACGTNHLQVAGESVSDRCSAHMALFSLSQSRINWNALCFRWVSQNRVSAREIKLDIKHSILTLKPHSVNEYLQNAPANLIY